VSLLWVRANAAVDYDGNEVDDGVHHIDHSTLAKMYSGDYDTRMGPETKDAMVDDWSNTGNYPGDPEYCHAGEVEHGGPIQYIEHLKKEIRSNGMQEPLTIRGGNVVIDGNHRGVAAIELRHPRIPVRYTR